MNILLPVFVTFYAVLSRENLRHAIVLIRNCLRTEFNYQFSIGISKRI